MKLHLTLERTSCILKSAGFVSLLNTMLIYLWNIWHIYWQNLKWLLLLRITNDDIYMTTASGKCMCLRRDDRGISRELATYGTHEPFTTKLLGTLIGEGMTVIDIGANIGHYVLEESCLVGPNGKIVAIEPLLENIEVLNTNLKLNNIHNVSVIQAAVSDIDGTGNLFLSPFSNWQSLQKTPSWQPSQGVREINTLRLDTLVQKLGICIDFIRMDIEGGECAAFKGISRTLELYKPRLAVEMHTFLIGNKNAVNILKMLKSLNYQVLYIVDRDRDYPWNHSGAGIRTIDIDSLMTDKVTVGSEKIITIFLE